MMSNAPGLHLLLIGGLVVLALGENGVFAAVLDVAAEDIGVDRCQVGVEGAANGGVDFIVVLTALDDV